MMHVNLKHIDRFVDRHGKPRHYFRAEKGTRVRLPGEPGSAEYLLAYERAAEELGHRRARPWTEEQASSSPKL